VWAAAAQHWLHVATSAATLPTPPPLPPCPPHFPVQVGQWVDEATDKTAGSLRIYKWHGPKRNKIKLEDLAADYDVVVTVRGAAEGRGGGGTMVWW